MEKEPISKDLEKLRERLEKSFDEDICRIPNSELNFIDDISVVVASSQRKEPATSDSRENLEKLAKQLGFSNPSILFDEDIDLPFEVSQSIAKNMRPKK